MTRLGAILNPLGAVLGPYWAVLEASTLEIADMPKTLENLKKINDFCLPGARPGRPVGRLGGRLGLLGALLGRLEAILGRLGALWVRLGALWGRLGASWCSLEPSGSRLGPSWSSREAAQAARTKKIGGRFSRGAGGQGEGGPYKIHYQATRAAKRHSNTPHRAQGTVAD